MSSFPENPGLDTDCGLATIIDETRGKQENMSRGHAVMTMEFMDNKDKRVIPRHGNSELKFTVGLKTAGNGMVEGVSSKVWKR